MAVLRLLGGGGILENNIVQTGASAGSSIASGVIFTLPALVILGYWSDFQYLETSRSRGRRHPRRAVHDAAAPRADHGPGPRLPRGRGDRRGAEDRREGGAGRPEPGAPRWARSSRWPPRPGSGCAPTPRPPGRGPESAARTSASTRHRRCWRRLHRRLQRRLGADRRHDFLNVAIPIYSTINPERQPATGGEPRGRRRRRRGRPI